MKVSFSSKHRDKLSPIGRRALFAPILSLVLACSVSGRLVFAAESEPVLRGVIKPGNAANTAGSSNSANSASPATPTTPTPTDSHTPAESANPTNAPISAKHAIPTTTLQAPQKSAHTAATQGGSAWKAAVAEGDARMKLKELVQAEAFYQQAVDAAKRDKTTAPDDFVICLERLGGVLQIEDKTQDSTPLYKKALHILQKEYGKDSFKLFETLKNLGDIFMGEAQYGIAAKYYRQAGDIAEEKLGHASLEFADMQQRLGLATFKAGFPLLAEKMYYMSLSIIMQQTSLPSTDLLDDVVADYVDAVEKSLADRRILSANLQAELLKDRVGSLVRKKNVAEAFWSKSVSSNLVGSDTSKELGNQSSDDQSIQPTADYSQLRERLSDSAALEQINQQRVQFYERMIAIDAKSLGAQHPSMARDLTGLAYIYVSQKKYQEAKDLLARALAIYRQTYGADPLSVKRTEFLLNLIDRKQGADAAAEQVPDYKTTLTHTPPEAQKLDMALRLNFLGLLCYSLGLREQAEKIYSWALAATVGACGQDSLLSGACMVDYAKVLRSNGNQNQAEQFESTAHKIVTRAMYNEASAMLP